MRILLTRLSSLGDIVHTWPLVEALAGFTPPPHLTWLVEEEYLPLVAPHPGVRRAIPAATRRWRRRAWLPAAWQELRATVQVLRDTRPDVVLDPQGLLKSAVWGILAGAPRRIGLHRGVRRERMAGLFYSETAPSPGPHRHAVDVALSLLGALGAGVPWGARPDGSFLLPADTHRSSRAVPGPVVLLPGTGRAAKTWGGESFVELAGRLAGLGWDIEILWGPRERAVAATIARAAGVRLAPPTPLGGLPRHLAGARGVIGGDTGPAHLAAALGVPTVMLHLATDPQRSGARGRRVVVLDGRAGGAAAITPAAVAAAAVTTFEV